jgi:hypothetical protein
VIGVVAAEAALSPADRLIEAVYHDDLTDDLRHRIASVLVAVGEAERFAEKGSISRRLNLLDQIEGRWRDVLGGQP